ncbi:MAG: hypothetical protein AAGJ08_03455 [Cyanobacteria bacterium P01_H01_bin.35]
MTQEIVNNSDILGLTGTFDSVSVELERKPANILSNPFFSQSTVFPSESSLDLAGNLSENTNSFF